MDVFAIHWQLASLMVLSPVDNSKWRLEIANVVAGSQPQIWIALPANKLSRVSEAR
jgi:hypothetical protein